MDYVNQLCLLLLKAVAVCSRHPVVPRNAIFSGHQNQVLQQCPLCGLDCDCRGLLWWEGPVLHPAVSNGSQAAVGALIQRAYSHCSFPERPRFIYCRYAGGWGYLPHSLGQETLWRGTYLIRAAHKVWWLLWRGPC